jgi:membrane fusion protein, multidrug efflux system
MRFQRSGFRPYDRGTAVLPPVSTRRPARRLWWVRPRTILLLICVGIVGAFAADRAWIRGNGIVAGELTPISPIVQARLQRLLVECLDHVKRGQQLAEFTNEATAESAAQQLQQLELQLTRARATIDIAEREANAAAKLVEAQAAVLRQLTAVLKAEDPLVQKGFVAALVWQQAKAAVERADAETKAAEFVHETKLADQKRAELDTEILERRIQSFKDSPELTGHFFLTAPTDGVVTECTAQVGQVIDARSAIFSIFNPNDTYAVVFFDPSDIPHLARGQSFQISIGGLEKTVTGTLTDFYPELSALPSSLTRYFWQEEKWSQYAPARIDFTNLSPAERSKIFAWAQLSATRSESVISWKSVRRHLATVWPFGRPGDAQDG